MKTQVLKKLAFICVGYPFRARIEPEKNGSITVVQLRNLQEDGGLDLSEAITVNLDDVAPQLWLMPGDVIFYSRGSSMLAALIPEGIGKAIAAAPLLLIRVKDKKELNSGYLVWFLNHHQFGQRRLWVRREGSNIKMVSKAGLSTIQIDIPSLANQLRIADFAELQRRENELVLRLQEKRNSYMDAVLMRCMQEASD